MATSTKKKSTSKITGFTSQAAKDNAIKSGRISASDAKNLPIEKSNSGGGSSKPAYNAATGATTGKPSEEYNTYLKSLNKTSSSFQDTSAIGKIDVKNTGKIDEKVKLYTGQSSPTGVYGAPVTDAQGNEIGKEMFDSKTGKPLADPNLQTKPTDVAGNITTEDGGVYSQTPPEGYDYQLPTPKDGGKYVYDNKGKPYLQDKTGAVTSDPTADAQYQVFQNAKNDEQKKNDLYDAMKVNLDASHQLLVDSIKQQAAQLKAKTEELNKRVLGLKRVQGYRTGSTEYTPEIGAGILKAEEEEGLSRIAEIDGNLNLALAQAETAKQEKDFGLLEKRMKMIDDLEKEKKESIQNIYKNYLDFNKYLDDQIKQANIEERANKDQALQELTVMAPELVKQYDSLSETDKVKWLEIMVERTGLDSNVLKGQLEKTRLEIKDKNSIMANRGKKGGGDADDLEYTDNELKKLRSVGIDPSDTDKADAYLYKDIDPEDYESTLPQLDASKLTFNFGTNAADEADKIKKINEALKSGYSIEEITQFMGFSKQEIELFKKAVTKGGELI